jgi:hypothetical protein
MYIKQQIALRVGHLKGKKGPTASINNFLTLLQACYLCKINEKLNILNKTAVYV